MHPFRELPKPEWARRIRRAGVSVTITPWPTAQIIEPLDAGLDVAAAVATSRAIAREHGKSVLGWWIAPEHDHLAPALVEHGLVNADTPGFEAIENAMALVDSPAGAPAPGVEVRTADTFEDYVAGARLGEEVFGIEPIPLDDLRPRYEEYRSSSTGLLFLASIDGRVVGSGFAALGDAGVNLFGGGVHPEARGRGVYRSLTLARWELAVGRDTPALTVQAGRMSMPILERLGFELVERVRVFVDDLAR